MQDVYIQRSQQHGVNSGVRLPNHYTHAKWEKVLTITLKYIRHFINILAFASTVRRKRLYALFYALNVHV